MHFSFHRFSQIITIIFSDNVKIKPKAIKNLGISIAIEDINI